MNVLDLDLSGATAMVTGAGQGVGASIARMLAAHGARVVVNDYVAARADAVAAEIDGVSAPGDVTDFEGMLAIVERIVADAGPISILVNNAGNAGANPSAGRSGPFWTTNPTHWRAFLGVNLDGVLTCCRATLPAMIEAGRGGRLITIISDAGRVGEAGLEVYSAAKAGAAGLMRALAKSLGRYRITSNAVAIGATRTPATESLAVNPELSAKVLRGYPIRRFGEPVDVASLVTFLASPAAGWITGQTYPVNGGYSAAL